MVPVALFQIGLPVCIQDLQYTSGLEVSTCSIDTDLNYDKVKTYFVHDLRFEMDAKLPIGYS